MSEIEKITLPVVTLAGEVHGGHDQLLYCVAGSSVAKIGATECDISDGDVSIVLSCGFHNFRNTGSGMLKLFTAYSSPEHEPGTEHATKAQADAGA